MFTIYGVPLSIHVRKVIIAALEKRLLHRFKSVFPFDPPPGWRDLSPTGKIPAMKHGELTLADSSVIVAYLEKRFLESPLNPRDPAQAPRALPTSGSRMPPSSIACSTRICRRSSIILNAHSTATTSSADA